MYTTYQIEAQEEEDQGQENGSSTPREQFFLPLVGRRCSPLDEVPGGGMLQGAPKDEGEDGHGDNRAVTKRKVRSTQ
jgi:hypothetical protein